MKRIVMVLTFILVALSFSSASAEEHLVLLDHVVGELPGDRLAADTDIQFVIRIVNNGTPNCMINPSMGFEISSTDGAEWGTTTLQPMEVGLDTLYISPDGSILITDTITFDELFNEAHIEGYSVTGNMADSMGFGAFTFGGDNPGVYEGMDTTVLFVQIHPTLASDGKHICFDNAPEMPSFEWEWSSLGIDGDHVCTLGDVIPPWDGPYCYEVWVPKDEPPVFDNPPTAVIGSHCETLSETFTAYDPDPDMGPGPNDITFSLGAGSVGSIHPTTGNWVWNSGDINDVGTTFTVWVIATEADGPIDSVSMTVDVTNDAPYLTSGCGTTYPADIDDLVQVTFQAGDNCPADPKTFSVVDNGGAFGSYSFAGNVLSYTPHSADLGLLTWTIEVSDGLDATTCTIEFDVTVDEPPVISGDLNPVGSHCGMSVQYNGSDPDGSDAVTFSLVSGVGSISGGGMYSYTGTMADVGSPLSAVIRATEADGEYTEATLNITVTNDAPVFTSGCGVVHGATIDDLKQVTFTADDSCPTDPKVFSIVDDAGAAGAYSFTGGVLSYTPDAADEGTRVWTVEVTDNNESSTCTFTFNVTYDQPPVIVGAAELTGSHCQTLNASFVGYDPEGADAVTFSLLSGVGAITPGGAYSYTGSMSDVGTVLAAEIRAEEADGEFTDLPLTITLTNAAPVFTSGCGDVFISKIGDEVQVGFDTYDDCPGDPRVLYVVDAGGCTGAYSVDGFILSFIADPADEGIKTWTMGLTDQQDTTTCTFQFDISPDQPPLIVGDFTINGSHCGTITGNYSGIDPDGNDAVTFSLIDGVGSISPTGTYTYSANIGDVGTDYFVTIRATEADGEHTEQVLTVTATNDAPQFSYGCNTEYLARTERWTEVSFSAYDNCMLDPKVFFVADDAGTNGTYSFDGGTLSYYAVEIDEGFQTWTIGVTDEMDTSYCTIEFEVFKGCCGLYSDHGHTGNADFSEDGMRTLTDITTLIDHIYIMKPPLACPEEGNTNGDAEGLVSLSDIVQLINLIYVNKTETAPCP